MNNLVTLLTSCWTGNFEITKLFDSLDVHQASQNQMLLERFRLNKHISRQTPLK